MALTDNIVAYWKLDGNSSDSVGSYNGTDTGISYSTSYGKINQGASYTTASSSRISTTYTTTQNQSWSFWIKTSTQQLQGIMGSVSTANYDDRVCWMDSTGKIRATTSTINGHVPVVSPTSLADGNWHHIVLLFSGTSTINTKLYIDGTLANQSTYTGPYAAGNRDFSIGFARGYNINNNWTAYYYNGYIDEVGIWNRLITETEITQLYNSGAGFQYPFSTIKPNLLAFT